MKQPLTREQETARAAEQEEREVVEFECSHENDAIRSRCRYILDQCNAYQRAAHACGVGTLSLEELRSKRSALRTVRDMLEKILS